MEDLVLFTEPEHAKPGSKLVKIPEPLYQIFFGWAQELDTDMAQRKVFRGLLRWRRETYPDYGLVKFWDFSAKEAGEINHHIGIVQHKTGNFSLPMLTWGMYVLLSPGESDMEIVIETEQIDNHKPDKYGLTNG